MSSTRQAGNMPAWASNMLALPIWIAPSFLFLFEKSSDGALLLRRFECVNEFSKPLGENFRTKFPVMGHTGRSNIMAKKPVPAIPELPVH